MSVFKNLPLRMYVIYTILAAVGYAISVVFFIMNHDYTNAWILYLGNVVFFLVILAFMMAAARNARVNRSTRYMVVGGHLLTVAAVVLSAILAFLLITFMMPGIYTDGQTERQLASEPDQMQQGKSDGLVFLVLMNALLFNFTFGSVASIAYAFYGKRDQTKEGHTLHEGKL